MYVEFALTTCFVRNVMLPTYFPYANLQMFTIKSIKFTFNNSVGKAPSKFWEQTVQQNQHFPQNLPQILTNTTLI